ncbi:PAS domain-containing sensor histidine kinase [Oleiphilus sp. HI0125]|uniref:phosphate regulon sensor histidine kinase PhoR n=2 Tax=Oleiphilus sp. HI0125 TaxID=1822266 RepID=UPI0007C2421F|nr:phosphate regulon sensor histidine kinase PhoR [Oleiphilus sp. HI0125]KZZ57294.1 PAS domain-containing sensor histidine kinase [Oleiphilus sp. HI0125]
MHKRASAHVRYLVWAFVLAVLLGLITDLLLPILLVFFASYSLWMVRQALRLHAWLYPTKKPKEVPESYGLWGDLFEGLYYTQLQNKKARKRLSKMIKRVRNSANALKDAVVMTNEMGQMDWWNEAATRLFGFDDDKDQAQLVTNLVRDPEFKAYFDAKKYDDALEITSPTDPNLIIRIHITLFGKQERLILAQDVTRLHHLEQMRRDFVSNVSHELRTPLTVIRGYLETLIDSEEAPEKWHRALMSMEGQTNRLEAIINDLLVLEKFEAQDRVHAEKEVLIVPLLESVLHDAELFSADNEHQISLDIVSNANIFGVENQLRSAISNIVFNAVKYTPAKGSVVIRWWQDHGGCHLSVTDTGCGFDPIHIPRLTERFYRADPSRNSNTGGSGLGLAIVKHVLINHGANLEVQSGIDQGSTFTCHFPNQRVVAPKD